MTIKHVMQTRLLIDKTPNAVMQAVNAAIRDMQDKGWEVDLHPFNIDKLGIAVLVEGIVWNDISDEIGGDDGKNYWESEIFK